MQVVHIISPVRFGGGESLLTNLLARKADGVQESIIQWYRSPGLEQSLSENGIAWVSICPWGLSDGVSKAKAMAYAVASLLFIPRLIWAMKRLRPDIVHVHSFPANMVMALLRSVGIIYAELIFTSHFAYGAHSFLQRLIFSRMWHAYAAITAVSSVVRQSMTAQYGVARKCVVIPNCVSDLFFLVAPRRLNDVPARRKVFLQMARFSPVKNHELVVDVLSGLPSKLRSDIEIWFAGDGETRKRIERRAQTSGLLQDGTVRFLGFVEYTQLPVLLAQVDFGLFPSDTEGFGIAAAECMAAGRPVLGLRNALMEEVVGEGGLLRAKDELGSGFVEMLQHGPALAVAAKKKAEAYRVDRVKDRYLGLYRDVLKIRALSK